MAVLTDMKPMCWRTWLGLGGDVEAGDTGRPSRGPQHGAEDAHGGGLAGAVGPEQAEDLPGPGLEADAIDGVDQPAAQVPERLGQVLDLDHDVGVQ
jgi:hypothetical protein